MPRRICSLVPRGEGTSCPRGWGRRGERLSRLQEAKARLEEEAARAAEASQEHLVQRQAEEAVQGRKKRGRKPRMVEAIPPEEAKANVTDPDSRVMKTRQGYVQGYNVQAVVSEDQIILAVGVTQEANDVRQLLPMLEGMNQNLAAAGIEERPGVGLADAGYWERGQPAGLRWIGPAGVAGGHHQGLEATEGGAGVRLPPRTNPQASEPQGADGAQAADETRSGSLQ